VRSFIVHAPSGTLLDFAEPDAFCQEVVADIVRRERRGEYRNHRTLPEELICYSHRNEKTPYVYLQERPGGLIVAAHWQGSGLAGSHEIAYHGMTPEHKRQAECWANGGTRAGNQADLEVWSPNRLVRNDVVIFGPAVEMAVEVQRSGLAIPAAKSRNTKTRREGREPLWAVDRDSHPIKEHVPTIGLSGGSWSRVPPPEAVAVTGLQTVKAVRCQDLRNGTCPNRRYGCNEWHPDFEPMRGMSIAAVAEMFPAGQLVPMQHLRVDGRPSIRVVLLGGKQLYEDLTGRSADVPLNGSTVQRIGGGRIECKWVAPWLPWLTGPSVQLALPVEPEQAPVLSPRCAQHGVFLKQLVPGTLYCPICHRSEMNARGLANYPTPA
jgi:hypothetical protein